MRCADRLASLVAIVSLLFTTGVVACSSMPPTTGDDLDGVVEPEQVPSASHADAGADASAPAPAPADEVVVRHRAVLNPAAAYAVDWARLPRYSIVGTLAQGTISAVLDVETTTPAGPPLASLVFRLFPNGRPIYGGRLAVSKVSRDGHETATTLEMGGTVLRVPLTPAAQAGTKVRVTIHFTTSVGAAGSGYGILNDAGGVLTLGSWFPLLALYEGGNWLTPAVPPGFGDAVSTETSLFDLDLTAPMGIEIAHTGALVERTDGGATTRWKIVSGPARELTLSASSRWAPKTSVANGVMLRFFAWPNSAAAAISVDDALSVATAAMKSFEAAFGPYPYRRLDIVEAPVPVGGYEYPGLVLFDTANRTSDGREISLPPRARDRSSVVLQPRRQRRLARAMDRRGARDLRDAPRDGRCAGRPSRGLATRGMGIRICERAREEPGRHRSSRHRVLELAHVPRSRLLRTRRDARPNADEDG